VPTADCPFCGLPEARIVLSDELACVIRDGFPVAEGHSLVLPRRHVVSFFETTRQEKESLLGLLERAKVELERSLNPAGYTIGINDGPAAGQTVPHLHIHLIPRYLGDVVDPRGGVRWVLPTKAAYRTSTGV